MAGSKNGPARRRRAAPLVVTAAAVVGLAFPAAAAPYVLTGTIPIPSVPSNTAGTFVGYDLSVFDQTTQLYYLTDRSNNGIDVFSSKTNKFVEQIGAGLFSGATPSNSNAGPNGISISNVGSGKLLIAGNGPSNLITFNLAADGLTVLAGTRTISTTTAGPPPTPTPPNRVDGVAYSPTANTILAANNASTPGFVTLIDNATGTIKKSILLNGTNGYPNVNGDGVEATVFNTARGTFFVAVPVFNGSGAGGVIELNASTGALVNTFDFNALGLAGGCGPTGVAQGAGATVVVACGDNPGTQTVVLDPTRSTGANPGAITTISQIGGGDQVSYDSKTNLFFEATRYQPGGPVLGVIDGATGSFLQTLPITFNDHSVAADPVSGEVFVAFGASATGNPDPYCAAGCIGVFAQAVPEPSALPVLALAVAGLGVAVVRRRRV